MSSEIEPCPFKCANTKQTVAVVRDSLDPGSELYAVRCECGYESRWFHGRRMAIAEHNRVARPAKEKT